jgi:alpha-tubulin suppressor-like RCC1 family protein
VLCWGNGQDQSKRYGWLGTGQSNTIGDENGEMGDPLVVVPLAEPTTGLALGFTSTCALSTTGNVRCFGTGRGGQLGNGDPDAGADVHDVATAAITATGVTSLFGHGPAYAALLADAGAITWGDDADGRLGLGDGLDRIAPVPLPAKAAVLAVSSASSHRCVILVGGDLYCAGNGEYGKLGYGDTLSRGATPETGFVGQLQPVLSKVALVALGGDHTCAVLEDDGVVCWGLNANGQLGTRDTNDLGGTPTTPASRLSPIRME